jgi:outer membrane immunogenic protein
MKKFLAGVSLAFVAFVQSANAADLSVPLAPPIAAPVYSWSGCYVGGSGGGIGSTSSFSTWGAGGYIGGQLGCNYQIGHLVVGIEGEGGWVDLNAKTTTGGVGFATTTSTKTNWDTDLAARFGIGIDRYLPYAKVGAMWMNNNYSTVASGFGAPVSTSGSATLPGFFFGFGIEYAMTPQWIARFETDFAFQNATSVNFTTNTVPPTSTVASENQISLMAKVGVSYKFW